MMSYKYRKSRPNGQQEIIDCNVLGRVLYECADKEFKLKTLPAGIDFDEEQRLYWNHNHFDEEFLFGNRIVKAVAFNLNYQDLSTSVGFGGYSEEMHNAMFQQSIAFENTCNSRFGKIFTSHDSFFYII